MKYALFFGSLVAAERINTDGNEAISESPLYNSNRHQLLNLLPDEEKYN